MVKNASPGGAGMKSNPPRTEGSLPAGAWFGRLALLQPEIRPFQSCISSQMDNGSAPRLSPFFELVERCFVVPALCRRTLIPAPPTGKRLIRCDRSTFLVTSPHGGEDDSSGDSSAGVTHCIPRVDSSVADGPSTHTQQPPSTTTYGTHRARRRHEWSRTVNERQNRRRAPET